MPGLTEGTTKGTEATQKTPQSFQVGGPRAGRVQKGLDRGDQHTACSLGTQRSEGCPQKHFCGVALS